MAEATRADSTDQLGAGRELEAGPGVAAVTPFLLPGSPPPVARPLGDTSLPAAFYSETEAIEVATRDLERKAARGAQERAP